MYEDGSFYNEDDISTCVKGAENKYLGEEDSESNDSGELHYALIAPDWEYIDFKDTGKEGTYRNNLPSFRRRYLL